MHVANLWLRDCILALTDEESLKMFKQYINENAEEFGISKGDVELVNSLTMKKVEEVI